MLDYEELEKIAKLKRLSLINAEKDYLQDVMLFSIYSKVGKELVFKGGTSLYKIYKLNRFSEDLDFTLSDKRVDIEELSKRILSNLDLLNIEGRIKEVKRHRKEINVRFLLKGPLYRGSKETQCFIPLNIRKEKVLLEPDKYSIISLYRELPNFEIFVMQEEEILAEKVRAIFTRVKPRDVYDLWFLLVKKNVTFDFSLINKKLSIYNLKFDFKEFRKRVDMVKGLWESDLRNLIIGDLKEFDKVKEELFEVLKDG